ncbi:MAG: hypothetical protein VXW65_02020 [Pseudomonadota bacterium]|nr:hypothetical protein [Pseudomonadota bacterium]
MRDSEQENMQDAVSALIDAQKQLFKNFVDDFKKSQQDHQQLRRHVDKEIERGSRATKHRINL